MKIEIKEYNSYELRFLRVLVSRKLYRQLMIFNYNLRVERYMWHGDSIMGHPDDKLEWVKLIETKTLLESTATTDYMRSFIEATKELKRAAND